MKSPQVKWFGLGLLLLVAACDLLNPPVTDPNHGAKIGDACKDSSTGGQSDCDPTQTCVAISKQNMCTVLNCKSNTDCGMNGSLQNFCVSLGGTPICVRACDPNNGASCGRADFLCQAADGSGQSHICTPDCRQQAKDYCGYGNVCNDMTGACEQRECSTSSGCPDGYICGTVDGASLCVPDCRNGSCPAARSCNTTGGCDTIVRKAWDTCGSTIGKCDSGLKCVQLNQTGPALCYTVCTADGDCSSLSSSMTGSALCNVSLSDGSQVCSLQCYPSFTSCPQNTSCVTDANLPGSEYCEPSGTTSGTDGGM